MHAQCVNFFNRIKTIYPDLAFAHRVLEHGSYEVDGTARDHFKHREWVGVDWRKGPRVDHVGFMHEFSCNETFDLAISVNSFEHDPYWKESLQRMVELLKPGGSLIVSAAGPSYNEHEIDCGPNRHYRNIHLNDLIIHVCNLTHFDSWLLEDKLDACLVGHIKSK